MKIVYCLAGTFNSGGMERIVISKVNWLADHGYDVTIVTTEQKGRPDFFPINRNVQRIDLDILYSETNSFGVLRKALARRRLIKRHKSELSRVLKSINPDIVISTVGNEVGFLPSIKDGSRKIAEIHFSRWYRLQLNRKGIWEFIDKYLTFTDFNVLKKYNKFVCLTNEDKLNWGKINNIEVIPNFIENNPPQPAQLNAKSMIAVGRLSYQKGYERLIEAWRKVAEIHPDWTLNIYGDGELKVELQQLISDANLSSVIKLHSPSHDIMNEYLKNSALVLSSRYEGMPMVLLEAMSAGLPLISFSCQCGPRDLIKSGVNGILVPEGDIQCLADSIIKVIENPALKHALGNNSYKNSSEYNKEAVMKRWTSLFNSLAR